jgi:hypothetical protein
MAQALLLVAFAVYSGVAIPLGVMLIYHDIRDKATGNSWERGIAVLLEACRIGLSVTGIYAVTVSLHLRSEVFLYDVVVLCNLQLFVGNNVGLLFLLNRLR